MLEIINLSAGYGDIRILENINIKVNDGDVVAIIGPNGAGKSTLVKAQMGLNTVFGGQVIFQGKNISKLSVHRRAREGLVLASGEIFPDMSVYENLLVGGDLGSHAEAKKSLEKVYEIFPILKERKSQKAGSLSGGERRMLVLGKAFMSKPKLLAIDEPSAGLSPIATLNLYKALASIAKETTILLLEQNVRMALSIARYCYILENGKIVTQGDVDILREEKSIKEKYFGI